jgi:NitT/TauT family transport system ATP-binding protein
MTEAAVRTEARAEVEVPLLLGPSGCGKSTLLKSVAGFIAPVEGEIRLAGERVLRPGPDRIVVFQEFDQLPPWKTVRQNVMFPLLASRTLGRKEAAERALHYLDKVGLSKFADVHPHQLSGGMKQRVAIARALAMHEPRVLLMDEPFAALDALTREKMNLEMLRIWERSRTTFVVVTHSIQEAVFLGSHCAVLTAGPARMADFFPIELPAPRTLHIKTSAEFGLYVRRIYDLLGVE